MGNMQSVYYLVILWTTLGVLLHECMTLSTTSGPDPCSSLDVDKTEKFNKVTTRLPQEKRKLNFVVIIAQSYNSTGYQQSIQFSLDLLDFLIYTRRLYIHPDYGRVSVLTYNSSLDGISVTDKAFHACEIEAKLQSLTPPHTHTLADSIDTSRGMFESRGVSGDNTDIVWILTDGMGGDVAEVLQSLAATVVRFVVGVGNLQPDADRQLASLASDSDHVACVDTWTELLKDNTPSGPEAPTERVYGLAEGCDQCNDDTQCACDVISRQYLCLDCQSIEGCPSTSPPEEFWETLWFILTVSACGLLLLIVILILICCCCCRKPEPEPLKAAPGLDQVDRRPPSPDMEEDVSPPATDMSLRSLTKSMPSRPAPPPPLPPRGNTLRNNARGGGDGVQNSAYENMETEEGMEGWGKYLKDQKQDNQLTGIYVHTESTQKPGHGAWTAGFQLPIKNLREIEKCLLMEVRPSSIRVGGEKYELDTDTVSQLSVQGSRSKRQGDGSYVREVMYAGVCGGYMVVVTADITHRDTCEQVFYEIQRHLGNNPTTPQPEDTQDLYENVPY